MSASAHEDNFILPIFSTYLLIFETFDDPSGYFKPILDQIYRFLRLLTSVYNSPVPGPTLNQDGPGPGLL